MLIDQKFDILKMNTVPLKKTKHLVFHVMLVFRGVTQMKGDLLMTPSKVSYYSNNTLNNWRMDTKILPKSKEYAFSNAPFLDVHVTSDKNETPIAYSYDSILPRKLTCPLKGDYFNFNRKYIFQRRTQKLDSSSNGKSDIGVARKKRGPWPTKMVFYGKFGGKHHQL